MVVNSGDKNITAAMSVDGCDVIFQLHTATNVNTIAQKYVRKEQTRPTKVCLNMWNKMNLQISVEAGLNVTNQRTGETLEVVFIVVTNGLSNLLGFGNIQQQRFVTINWV